MAAALSILLIIIGGVLIWADANAGVVDVTVIGVVVMIIGSLALLVSLIVFSKREVERRKRASPDPGDRRALAAYAGERHARR